MTDIKNKINRLEKIAKENIPKNKTYNAFNDREMIKEMLRPNDVAPNDKEYHRIWDHRFDSVSKKNPYEALTEEELRQLIKYAERETENTEE